MPPWFMGKPGDALARKPTVRCRCRCLLLPVLRHTMLENFQCRIDWCLPFCRVARRLLFRALDRQERYIVVHCPRLCLLHPARHLVGPLPIYLCTTRLRRYSVSFRLDRKTGKSLSLDKSEAGLSLLADTMSALAAVLVEQRSSQI